MSVPSVELYESYVPWDMVSATNNKVIVSVTASFSAFVSVDDYASVRAIVIVAVNDLVSVSLSQVSIL